MKKVLGKDHKVDEKAVRKVAQNEELSKSARMKELFELGLEVKEIAAVMGVRYNFAYNVISNYVNINAIPVEKAKMESKKDKIIELYLAGKSNKEISIDLKTNYNYVINVIKAYVKEQAKEQSAE